MNEFKVGDRGKVIWDLTGIDAFVGRTGVITAEAKHFEGKPAVDPLVRLDGKPVVLRDLHFAAEELELVDADAEAEHADAANDMDKAERQLDGAR